MDSPNPSSMRVLTRPPLTHPTLTPPIPPNQTDHQSPNGVVVVGFIGRRTTDVTQLINRVVDANVFGSGKLDKDLGFQKGDGDWFKCRRISYYDDDENGILYLQFSSTVCPAMEEVYDSCSSSSGFDSEEEEEREFGDLQGMLFMFSVCHVIIFIQEGSSFDTQILKRLRILQSAKHAMAPFNKSQSTPPSTSSSHSSSSRSSASGVSFNNRSPGRSGVILSRNASAISIRSGLGSYTSLFPGQCSPVILFVFLDDLSDINTGTSNIEETVDSSSLNQSSSLSNLAKTSLPPKGSAPVVLVRPVSKSEGGFKKKLQSSLEAQIRFSIKKCRTLAGSETSHAGSRSGASSNSAPLFSLDASKAVALLDIYSNQSGKSLDFTTRLVEDILNGKATSDSLLLETHSQSATLEDIVSVKEFIHKQADILRGRGGVASNANSGSAAGVGMVAVAAAAAAASAASGKAFTAPELPSVDIWVSSSLRILQGILSAESGWLIIESESSKRNPHQKNTVAPAVEGVVSRVTDNPLQTALSCLESGKGLNTKFSTLWCQRALPSAKEVYLSDLPACYPTSKHEVQLEKALRAFCSMVKGPAVPLYMKQLEDECTSIWSSGRQLCDAVSLTGKPCMHQRHDVETNGLVSIDVVKPHSSGFVFLKACACGRSRLLQSDPFDFETANITSSNFADCDKLLPSLQLPQVKNVGPIQPSSWNLVRVGGAKYYDPSKGLLQSGFCATQKFLLKWKVYLENPKNQHDSLSSAVRQGSVVRLSTERLNGSITRGELNNSIAEELQSGNNMLRERLYENNQTDEKKLSFGRGIPSFTMRKPFSEVVAGSAAAISGFPPLQSRKQLSVGTEKSMKQSSTTDRVPERVHHTADNQGSQQSNDISAVQDAVNGSEFGVNRYREGNPILQIGSNVVPVNMSSCQKIGLSDPSKTGIVYVGFEHECPRGHRFILTTEHLKGLGSPYSLSEESHIPSSIENSDNKRPDPSKLGRNGTHGKAHRNSNRMNGNAVRKVRNMDKTKEIAVDGVLDGKQQTQSFIGMPTLNESLKDSLHSVSIDDGVYSLLNRSLPIYMNCPHCRTSKNKKDNPKIKFAGTVSQLQRIFLVTPPFPVVLASCPVIQFEASCLPPSVPDREQKLQFTFGCPVILPPESFLSLRLPFVYGVRLEDGSLQSLRPFEHQPEATAWIAEGTTLQVISKGSTMFDGSSEKFELMNLNKLESDFCFCNKLGGIFL